MRRGRRRSARCRGRPPSRGPLAGFEALIDRSAVLALTPAANAFTTGPVLLDGLTGIRTKREAAEAPWSITSTLVVDDHELAAIEASFGNPGDGTVCVTAGARGSARPGPAGFRHRRPAPVPATVDFFAAGVAGGARRR